MAYSVFIHRSDSIYDDSPAEQYQFPKQYHGRVQQSIGDWIVYLEPSKVVASRGYFAIARVQQVIRDPKSDMYLALVEPGTYLDFAHPVSFRDQNGPVERGLLNRDGRLSGRAQSAVRPISLEDFHRIVDRGLDERESALPRIDDTAAVGGFEDEQAPSELFVRDRIQQMTSRVVRDRVFRKIVIRAYDERCAISGFKFINGSGRAEVDAAHIQPVQHNGPDVVNNGIALSGTAHWMFDRGLISLSNDLDILISRQVNDVESVRSLISKSGSDVSPDFHPAGVRVPT
ncbi:MAG TPA: HNH endonuclease [Aestuariivirgaceae bacterium]|nr:HNH endonuclease [Aestuariivirgaceae bacterium]